MPRSSIAAEGVAVAERLTRTPSARTPESSSAERGRRPRLYLVDGIRLAAALLVVMHHFAGTRRADQPGNAFWDRPVGDIMPTVFRAASFGWIGVEIFFVISGFVICMSCWGRTPRQFFVSRVIRLYPAYWFAVLFSTAVLVALPGVWERLPARDVLFNLTMLQSGSRVPHVDAVYWTLWSELRFYLLFLVVVALGPTYRRVVVFCCVWGAAAMLAPLAELPLLTLVAQPDGAWYFIAGLALYLMHRFGQDLLLWGILGMSWLMAQHELAERVVYEGVSSWRGALLIYTVFLLVMVATALGRADRFQWRWLATAGSLTYPLYLLHYVVGTTLINRLRDTTDPRLLLVVLTAGFLVLAWLVHRFVERPLSRAMKRGLEASFSRLRGLG